MKYVKKPVLVDAVQFISFRTEFSFSDEPDWFIGAIKDNKIKLNIIENKITIVTKDGNIIVQPTDYIIKGFENELYKLSEDIFIQSHEQSK